jgi:hypothetical protein
LHLEDNQHTAQWKVKSFCLGNSFWCLMPLTSQWRWHV